MFIGISVVSYGVWIFYGRKTGYEGPVTEEIEGFSVTLTTDDHLEDGVPATRTTSTTKKPTLVEVL